MFKASLDALRWHKQVWDYSGYWANVVVEYGKLTGWDIGKSAKQAGDEKLLDKFCRTAQAQGLSHSNAP